MQQGVSTLAPPGFAYDVQDWGRKFLPANGGCVYIDLDHLELCLPEVLSAHDHVAAWQAMLLLAREAMESANAKLPEGQKLHVLVNNSDGQGNSYGSHMDFLVSRRCFENIFHRKLHHMLFLASYLASSIVFTGAGKVGSENGRPAIDFQLSQRADFYETLTGVQTTFRRPIVNSRDESLCGSSPSIRQQTARGRDMARLHVIFFDNTLCHVASLLKVGVTQIILAMIEQEYVDSGLILDDPLRAVIRWSHDPALCSKARLLSKRKRTVVGAQMAFLERAGRFVAAGRAEGLIPRAGDLLELWGDTLQKLQQGEVATLASRLDWVLKRCLLERARRQRGLAWNSPQLKHLDLLYGSLDPTEGMYWTLERSGKLQKVVSDGEIERFVHEPPEDTRAWLRSRILRRADPATIEDVDWDLIRFRYGDNGRSRWPSATYLSLPMHNPLEFTRRETEDVLEQAPSVQDALRALGAQETDFFGRRLGEGWQSPSSAPVGTPPGKGLNVTWEAEGESANAVNGFALKSERADLKAPPVPLHGAASGRDSEPDSKTVEGGDDHEVPPEES